MTFIMGENETEIVCVDKERAPVVFTKCEGNPLGVSTCSGASRYRREKIRNGMRMTCIERRINGMKLAERVLEKSLHRILSVDEMQLGFMPDKGTIDAVFILRRKSNNKEEKE